MVFPKFQSSKFLGDKMLLMRALIKSFMLSLAVDGQNSRG